MGTQRYIDTSFWDDAWIQELDPSQKFLYLYLLTNPLTNVAGISELTIKRICFDTGFNSDTVKNILNVFEEADKVYNWGNYIILKNAPKHQIAVKTKDENSKETKVNNIYKGIVAILNQLPDELLQYLYYIEYAFEDLTDILDAKEIDYSEIITISEVMNSNEHKEFERACKGFEGLSKTLNYSNSDLNTNSDLFKAKKSQKKQFIPPTLEEVTAYIQEKHYSVDPKTFFEYYTETEWKDVSGKKIKNWKGKVVTWNSRNNNQQSNKSNWYDSKNIGKAESDRFTENVKESDIPF